MHIILGLIGVVIGAFFVIKTEALLGVFGRVNWAEIHLGAEGGTRLFYKLLGIGIIIVGFLGMTGLLGKAVLAIFSPLFRGLQ